MILLTSVLSMGCSSLQAIATETQAQEIFIPVVNPITGKIEYVFCQEAPHCDSYDPPLANVVKDNN